MTLAIKKAIDIISTRIYNIKNEMPIVIKKSLHSLKKEIVEKKKTFIICNIIAVMMALVLKFNVFNWIFGMIVIGMIIPLAIYNNKILILFQLLFSMTVLAGKLYLGLNGIFKILPDFFTAIIFIKLIIMYRNKKISIKNKYIFFVGIILVINVISFIVNKYSVLTFIAGLRNYYVFYISFLGYIFLDLKKNEIKGIFNIVTFFAFIQIPLTIFQYFHYVKKDIALFQDYVAGTFGEMLNGDLGFLIIVVVAFYVAALLHKKVGKLGMISVLLFAIPIIFGEIKIAILALPIVLFAILVSKITKRNLKILVVSIGVIGVIFAGLVFRFPEFRNMFNIKYIKYYAYDLGYGGYELNRLSAPIYVNEKVLINTKQKLFGIGIGNGTNNGSEILNSKFYKENKMLGAELFFSSVFLMENGWIGLILFITMIISILVKSIKISKLITDEDELVFLLAVRGIMVMIFISFVYSLSIFNLTMGYLIFFILGTVIRISKNNNEKIFKKTFVQQNSNEVIEI